MLSPPPSSTTSPCHWKKTKERRKKVPWIGAHLEDILCISHMGEKFRLIIIINKNMNQTQIRTINKQDQSGACQSSNADDTQFLAAAQVRFGRLDRSPRFCLVVRELKRGRKCHRRTIMSSLCIMIEVFVMNSSIGGGAKNPIKPNAWNNHANDQREDLKRPKDTQPIGTKKSES
jgi:hypothetical protein